MNDGVAGPFEPLEKAADDRRRESIVGGDERALGMIERDIVRGERGVRLIHLSRVDRDADRLQAFVDFLEVDRVRQRIVEKIFVRAAREWMERPRGLETVRLSSESTMQ